jgi:glycosyltransferase involved in cell wall biosynthesis
VKVKAHDSRIVFVQPVLAPYAIPRYRLLAKSQGLDIHLILEAHSFPERPGWIPRKIENCTIHVANSILKKKKIHNKVLNYSEKFTKAIPYGISFLLFGISPTIIIFCNPTQMLCSLPYLLQKKCSVGIIMEDTLHSQSHRPTLIGKIRKVLYQRLDFAFCFSQDAVIYIKSLRLKTRIYRSSWSIESDWLRWDLPNRKNTKGTVTFLFVGQLIHRKGVMPLLHAWQKFSQTDSAKKQLILIGEGPLRGTAESFSRKAHIHNVHFIGGIPYKQVKRYYSSSDIFILPTMEDLFTLVVTEAMAYGLPVMTSIYNGASELIRPGENGWVFDSKDVASILQALEDAWANRRRFADMGKLSRDIISEYTHESIMAQMSADLQKEISQAAIPR